MHVKSKRGDWSRKTAAQKCASVNRRTFTSAQIGIAVGDRASMYERVRAVARRQCASIIDVAACGARRAVDING